jgi:hypothetical protein
MRNVTKKVSTCSHGVMNINEDLQRGSGAVAKATGWGAPAQGSISGCCTIYSNLWLGAHLLVTVAVAPFR